MTAGGREAHETEREMTMTHSEESEKPPALVNLDILLLLTMTFS